MDTLQDPEDPRDTAILAAAFEVFANYGFRRAAMADIAARAGMSRPALYLRFSGKEQIFKRLATLHLARAEAGAAAALAAPGAPDAVLGQFFAAIDGEVVEAMLSSPHGAELLDAKPSVAAEIAAAGEARMVTLLAGWIARGQAEGWLSGSLPDAPPDIAATILAAKFGLKSPGVTLAGYKAGTRRLASLFGRALSP
jgi:AcrR family transcriptional regulator